MREVHLAEEDVARRLGDGLPVGGDGLRLWVEAVGERRHQLDVPQVNVEELEQVFALHLDHDLLARAQHRAVDLRERGRRERLAVEGGEELIDALAELGADDRERTLGREGRHLVLEPRELRDHLRWEHVHSRGEQLTDLDEGGPEPHERIPQHARQLAPRLHQLAARQPTPVQHRDAEGLADDTAPYQARAPRRPERTTELTIRRRRRRLPDCDAVLRLRLPIQCNTSCGVRQGHLQSRMPSHGG